jgi:hypothetical protein
MMASSATFIKLSGGNGEWHGSPDAGTGVFAIGERYKVHFLHLWVEIQPVHTIRANLSLLGGRSGDKAGG